MPFEIDSVRRIMGAIVGDEGQDDKKLKDDYGRLKLTRSDMIDGHCRLSISSVQTVKTNARNHISHQTIL